MATLGIYKTITEVSGVCRRRRCRGCERISSPQTRQTIDLQGAIHLQSRIQRNHTRILRSRLCSGKPSAVGNKGGHIDHPKKATTDIQDATKPRARIGHRLQVGQWINLPRLPQWKKVVLTSRPDGEPSHRHTLIAGSLQAASQPGLEFSDCFSVSHERRESAQSLDFGQQFGRVYRFGNVVTCTLAHTPHTVCL